MVYEVNLTWQAHWRWSQLCWNCSWGRPCRLLDSAYTQSILWDLKLEYNGRDKKPTDMESNTSEPSLSFPAYFSVALLRCQEIQANSPFLHARLDLDGLVARVDDPDVDLAGVGLLLPQEVVDPGLDVGAEAGDGQALRREAVLSPLRSAPLVAVITGEPGEIKISV